jgi:plastocyanin
MAEFIQPWRQNAERSAIRSAGHVSRVVFGSTVTVGLLCLFSSPAAHAADQEIRMFAQAFLPQTVSIEAGDTVMWTWIEGDHTVTSGLPGGEAGTTSEPGALFDAPLDSTHPSFAHAFGASLSGGVPFFCRRHPEQVGFVEISSGELTVRVGVVDNFFVPEEVYLFEGDSVRWEHETNEGYHTITSGLSSRPEDSPGALFDEESSDARPIFVYRFEQAGEYPYFCRPHEHAGMKGVVRVQRRFLRGDANADGILALSDAVATLGFLFLGSAPPACKDAMDSNDDGTVDIGDPVFTLSFLFLGGPAPPRPYPLPGADRSEDGLTCGP